MRKNYPSDISREAFEQIRPLLEGVRKQTKPRTVDLYEVFCGVLYLLKSGCQWRMLPSDFPKWRTVHSYFAKWSEPDPDGFSVLERATRRVLAFRLSNTLTADACVDALEEAIHKHGKPEIMNTMVKNNAPWNPKNRGGSVYWDSF
jgi:transposase